MAPPRGLPARPTVVPVNHKGLTATAPRPIFVRNQPCSQKLLPVHGCPALCLAVLVVTVLCAVPVEAARNFSACPHQYLHSARCARHCCPASRFFWIHTSTGVNCSICSFVPILFQSIFQGDWTNMRCHFSNLVVPCPQRRPETSNKATIG